MTSPMNLYRRESTHYLNEHASSGMQSHMAAMSEAATGSKLLLNAITRQFDRFERKHGLKRGEAQILMLDTGLR